MSLSRNTRFSDVLGTIKSAFTKAKKILAEGFVALTGRLFGTAAVVVTSYFAFFAFIQKAMMTWLALIVAAKAINTLLEPERQIDTVNLTMNIAGTVKDCGVKLYGYTQPLVYSAGARIGETGATMALNGAEYACNSIYDGLCNASESGVNMFLNGTKNTRLEISNRTNDAILSLTEIARNYRMI